MDGPARTPAALARAWTYAKLALALLLALLALLLVFQNREVTPVVFLRWEGELSLSLVVLLTLIAGLAIGVVISWWWRRRAALSKQDGSPSQTMGRPSFTPGIEKGRD